MIGVLTHNPPTQITSRPTLSIGSCGSIHSASVAWTQLLMEIVEFEGNWLSAAWASRIEKGGVEFPFENLQYLEGQSFTSSTQHVFQLASQDLEHLILTLRPDDYTTNGSTSVLLCSGTQQPTSAGAVDVTFQLSVQGVPVSNQPLAWQDCMWSSMCALGASGGAYDWCPDAQSTNANNIASYPLYRFVWVHSFGFSGLDPDEARAFSSGLNTLGQNALFQFEVNNSNTTAYRPVALARMKSLLSIQPGGIIAVIN